MDNNKAQQKTSQTEPHKDSIEAMVDTGINIAYTGASAVAAPAEILCRWWQGSRYNNIVILPLAQLGLIGLTVAGVTGGHYVNGGHGLIGIGWVYAAFQIGLWLHYLHVINVMIHPEKERDSREDGVPLAFWKLLPYGSSWNVVRFVYEPGLLIGAGVIGMLIHLFTRTVGLYLVIAGLALVVKVSIIWFRAWQWIRDILDEFARTKKVFGGGSDGGMESIKDAIARVVARVPVSLPAAALASVKQTASRALPAGLQSLLDQSKALPA
jgi:hypothetical protein